MLTVSKQEFKGGNSSHLPGTFVGPVTIVHAEDLAKQDIFHSGTPVDCGVKVTLEVGRDFQPEMSFYGNFKEENGKLGWGSAFLVREFLATLGVTGDLNEDGTIPADMLSQLINRKFIRLSYVRGYDSAKSKKLYADYKFIAIVDDFDDAAKVEKASKKLTEKFIRDVKSNRVRNFKPDAEQQSATSFP